MNGKYTDSGYRLRENEYMIQKAWWNIFGWFIDTQKIFKFYDVKKFNHDVYDIPQS